MEPLGRFSRFGGTKERFRGGGGKIRDEDRRLLTSLGKLLKVICLNGEFQAKTSIQAYQTRNVSKTVNPIDSKLEDKSETFVGGLLRTATILKISTTS